MIWMLVAGAGVAAGIIIVRTRRASRSQPDGKSLLALLNELFDVARDDGRRGLEKHAADWRASSIFRRYPSIANDAVVRSFLLDALFALGDHTTAAELDHQLSSSLRVHRKKPIAGDKRDASRRERTLEHIRRSTLSMSRIRAPRRISHALMRLHRPH
ncbi:MAG TPA: hypothetical protein VL463_35200 [Kofleriaceae bacterium]|jgi:hypothetical protein|nr:hypothetical protein [Kofleriaceae bacterium]